LRGRDELMPRTESPVPDVMQKVFRVQGLRLVIRDSSPVQFTLRSKRDAEREITRHPAASPGAGGPGGEHPTASAAPQEPAEMATCYNLDVLDEKE